MYYLQTKGIIIPDQISIVGFDDSRICEQARPGLTTVRQDNEKRAAVALRELLELKGKKAMGKEIRLPVTIVERNSVKRINFS